ncbi:unnamed protein product [Cuscuta epithymum]|uniref:CCR4-NOT transcription complex subunit 4 n=2 Tax=Cuscuta epithymum TaxID=186058 RepID=A0AAV0C0T1_9ASTE|nr:unnamed protein product [Cuscuta epithymum]
MGIMNGEEEKKCPLCAEEMDWTDQQFKPCKCGYQVCVWCWHHIMDMSEKEETEGRCPACRTIYDKEKVVAMQTDIERVKNSHANGKTKPPKAKPKTNEVKKDLTNVRVIQRKMAYVIGLPLTLADEDLLQRKQYFGQYGKVTKVSLSRTAGGAVQQFINDSCSVYITYSKEEEAVRCIQSVHGFVLDGRFLRASFGTAKYCHAWLRNMPCNNTSCLYLHSLGADEDSFRKDETAAIHTRNRVQQVAGATNNVIRRSGSMLPPPVDEIANSGMHPTERTLAQNATFNSINGSLSSSGSHVPRSIGCNDKDGGASGLKRPTTFVDIVGRSSSSDLENDGNSSQSWKNSNLRSDISGSSISREDYNQDPYSDTLHFSVSSSNYLSNQLQRDQSQDPYSDTPHFNVPSSNYLSNQMQRDQSSGEFSDETFREDLISSDGQGSQDSNGLWQRTSFIDSSHPENLRESTGGHLLLNNNKGTSSFSDIGLNLHSSAAVYKQEDEASLPLSCANLVLSEGHHDMKFQRSAKADMVYRSSNSFSNEEIVEHLRRIEDDLLSNDADISAFGPVESSIISNFMSMNFDDEAGGHHGSSRNSVNFGQSRLPLTNQNGILSQVNDLEPPFRNISQMPKPCPGVEYEANKEHYLCNPQYQVPRARSFAPPGFSVSSTTTMHSPPGFASEGAGGFPRRTSGSGSNAEFVDPAILSFVKSAPMNTEMSRVGFAPPAPQQRSSLDDEARLWLLMQQQQKSTAGELSSQIFAPSNTTTYQDHRFLGGNDFSSLNNYGYHHQQQTTSNMVPQPPLSRGYQQQQQQHGWEETQCRNEAGMRGVAGEVDRNLHQRLGGANYFSGSTYGDLMFQAQNSGDVYTRGVFGMM